MDEHDERDDLTDDDHAVIAHRARAASMLDRIVAEVKQTLVEAGIDIDLFFIVPSSGDAILTFGTPSDPDGVEWNRIGTLVEAVVRQELGLNATRRREVQWATT